MPKFEPRHFAAGAEHRIRDGAENLWAPILEHSCSFDSSQFVEVMTNFVHNPNLNSNWLFRADILFSQGPEPTEPPAPSVAPRILAFEGFELQKALVRRLIPRNSKRDQPLDQTCLFLRSDGRDRVRSLVVYIPHISTPDAAPFYHPPVRGIAHLHEWTPSVSGGNVSIHLWPFSSEHLCTSDRTQRTAQMLLQQLHKHGEGNAAGYVKRVTHDVVVPREKFQDRLMQLKNNYAKELLDSWTEQTDPKKHVFEDIAIAAFLIELWADMYKGEHFPGFVDIGCGNGLLVHLLRREGYSGWGFDARARKSWSQYSMLDVGGDDSLQARVLLPSLAVRQESGVVNDPLENPALIHDGEFPTGTFIISNHADELTPWTPVLAAQSQSPFIIIPCCSHDLSGAKFRAPQTGASKGTSSYASLVSWVSNLASECGYEVETEMLRIPSTRNTALVGRNISTKHVDLEEVVSRFGGTAGYYENVSKLLKGGPRGH